MSKKVCSKLFWLKVEKRKVNPELGGFEEIAALLTLPDEHFVLIAPVFLAELEKALTTLMTSCFLHRL